MVLLSAFLAKNQQYENIGRELVFSADLCYNGSSKKAFLREEGGTRSVTEGACATLDLHLFFHNALSLSRLRRQLPPGGSLGMCATIGVWALPEAFVIQMRNWR